MKKNQDPKAVIFVPFTPGSALAEELREVEEMMEKMSGTRFKIVERAGIQLQRIISRTNPWAGSDYQRQDCMICETRLETGDNKGMACNKRSCLYETWCKTCMNRDEQKAIDDGKNPWIQQ